MTPAQQVLDFDVDFMRNGLGFVDGQNAIVNEHMRRDFETEGDSAWVDHSEYLHGIGFVTAQKYLASAFKVLGVLDKKKRALAVGPRVNADVSCAELVEAVANHWKHIDEWNFDSLQPRQQATREILEKAGLEVRANGGDYVASKALSKFNVANFSEIIPKLKEWSDDVALAFPQP